MPRKLRHAKGRREPVDPYVVRYLQTGELPTRGAEDGDWFQAFLIVGPHEHQRVALREEWRACREALLEAWIAEAPGTRPHGWWLFDAPRWPRTDLPPRCRDLHAGWLATLADPRRRIGGIGTPAHEVLNVVPVFACGMPSQWVSPFQEEYYNGRRLDIHGHRIGTEYAEGHFAGLAPRREDPPRFESQATYLERHGLLPPAERRRLTAQDFAPESLVIEDDDEPDARETDPETWDKPCFDETRETH